MKPKPTKTQRARAFADAWPGIRHHLPAEHRATGNALVNLWLASQKQKSLAGSMPKGGPLTGQEARIAGMLRDGQTQAAIAQELGVTPGALTRSPVMRAARVLAKE